MEKTRNILMMIFWAVLLIAGALYVCGDFLEMDMNLLVMSKTHYYLQMLIILLTLAIVPLALRLFKFKAVESALRAQPAHALLKWGTLRLAMLGSMLILNTLLYYIYGFEPAYGYLAVMIMLTMPFVFPTMSRCKAETAPDINQQTDSEEA